VIFATSGAVASRIPSPMRLFAAAIALATLAAPAQAGLLGSNVTLRYDYLAPGFSTDTIAVGAGIEVTCTGGGTGNANVCAALTAATQTIDIGDSTIGYAYVGDHTSGFNNVVPNGMAFLGLDAAGAIVGVDLSTSISGLDGSRVSFTANSVTIDLHGLTMGTSGSFALALRTEAPGPATALLVLPALGALAAARRRRAAAR
jgi:hypothetical protein